jgi:hypothetical protein
MIKVQQLLKREGGACPEPASGTTSLQKPMPLTIDAMARRLSDFLTTAAERA